MDKPLHVHIFFFLSSLLAFHLPSNFFDEILGTDGQSANTAVVQIDAMPSGSQPDQLAGYCQNGQSTVTFTNLGMANDPAQSIITDLSLGIALGDNFMLQDGGFEITSVRIAGINISNINAVNSIADNVLFSNDPDGAGGLSDADNDGFFDDLELGQSVEITATYAFDCSLANTVDLATNCLNNAISSLNARLGYSENGQPQSFELNDYLRPTNENVEVDDFAFTDAFVGVDTFQIIHKEVRRLRSLESNCNGQFIVDIIYPNGYVPIVSGMVLLKNNQDAAPFVSSSVNGNVLSLVYDASFSNLLSGEYAMVMSFTTTCFIPLGESSVFISLSHFCPECDCTHLWYCGDVAGPTLHASTPPCPAEILIDCDEGIQTYSFDVNRQTFGFENPEFTVLYNPSSTNGKVAMPCDQVSMNLLSIVGETPINDSVGIVIGYGDPGGIASGDELFQFQDGGLRVTHEDTEIICPADISMLSTNLNSSGNTLTFNFDNCISNLGFSLVEGDTLEFTGNFSINPNGVVSNEFLVIPDFRASAFATLDGINHSCDNFGETFTIGRSRAVYDFPNQADGRMTVCSSKELHYRLFVPENDFTAHFGDEFRAAQKIDSFVFDFDPVLLNAYSDIEVMVSIPGHPFFGDAYFPISSLKDFPNGHYVAVFDTLDYVPSLNIVEEYSFDLKLNLTPTCLAEQNNELDLISNIYYQDRYHAFNIDNGICVNSKNETGNNTLVYSFPPEISLELLTLPFDTVQGGQAEWELQICNNSTGSSANVVWLAVEDLTGSLNVISIENVTDPNNSSVISLNAYGANNVFGYAPSLAPTECVVLRLLANIDGCQNLNFDFKAGWNCVDFPDPNWTPADNVCGEETEDLVIVNAGSSSVDFSFSAVTSICQNNGELVTVTGNLFSSENLPPDDFTLIFVFDENGDGEVQLSEPILYQETLTGSITPSDPISFEMSFAVASEESCRVIAFLEAVNTELCGGVEVPMPLPQLGNAGIDQIPCTLSGSTITTVLGDPSCATAEYNYFWTALPPASINDLDDPDTPTPTIAVDWANVLGENLTYILETERSDCGLSTFDTVVISIPSASEGFFPTDSIYLQAPNCQSVAAYCLGIMQTDLPDFEIILNATPYPDNDLTVCNGNELAVQLELGEYELVMTSLETGCSDTIWVHVSCTQTEVLDITLLVHQSDTVCFSSNELTGSIQSITNLCPDEEFVEYEILDDTCIILTGLFVGGESACFIACDDNDFCDTTFINTTVLHPIQGVVHDTLVVSESDLYCFETNLLNIAGAITSIENVCPGQSGEEVEFTVDTINNCILYDALFIGTDTACVGICDEFGNCDTINVFVTVVPGFTEMDTVFITVDTNTFCIDSSLLPGDNFMVEDVCPDNNGEQVFFEINGNCVSYFGDELGEDTICLRIEDEFGNTALVNLIVTVVMTTPDIICDNIFIGEIKEFCLDTTELPGIYTDYQILFDNNDPANVSFDPNFVNLCVRYEGMAEGQDSFIIALCDHFGFCDTTTFCITVDPYFEPPGLTDDTTNTVKETLVVIDPLANDTVFGGLESFFILTPPISGSAIINLDGSISYVPDPPFCARWDEFTYVVCNPNGCDTATVNVFIECVELTIFNAVSPNNDDVNDYFYISKLENFPNHRLWVYNRWGNLVFDSGSKGYENNWPGTWGDDIDLPDGTYYYIFEWEDNVNEVKTIQRGFFEMYR